jgi:hypothetical protein
MRPLRVDELSIISATVRMCREGEGAEGSLDLEHARRLVL